MDLGIIILAIIQGIAEFLPISSSAHLIIFSKIFGLGSSIGDDLKMTFDIALHFGTLLAIGVYFFFDFIAILKNAFDKKAKKNERNMLWYLVVATIPGALAGLLFEEVINNVVRENLFIIGSCLIIMGIIIYLIDKNFKEEKKIDKLNLKEAFLIGCSQAFALIPGFSRSGTTIAAGRLLNLDRESAAKFSFYLSAPIVLGAVTLELLKDNTIALVLANVWPFAVGVLVAFIVGLLCIKFLLKYLKTNDFKIFMWYRLAMGLFVIIWTCIH